MSNASLVIGKPAAKSELAIVPPVGAPGQPIQQGPTIYDFNFECTTRYNAAQLADKLLEMARNEKDPARAERMTAHAYELLDQTVAPAK